MPLLYAMWPVFGHKFKFQNKLRVPPSSSAVPPLHGIHHIYTEPAARGDDAALFFGGFPPRPRLARTAASITVGSLYSTFAHCGGKLACPGRYPAWVVDVP